MIGKFMPAANQMKNWEIGLPCRSESEWRRHRRARRRRSCRGTDSRQASSPVEATVTSGRIDVTFRWIGSFGIRAAMRDKVLVCGSRRGIAADGVPGISLVCNRK